ncbi:MAG: hypothetical protein WCF30_10825 [Terracidiphilus sp.]
MKSIVGAIVCLFATMSVLGQSGSFRHMGTALETQPSLGVGSETQSSFGVGSGTNHRVGVVADWSQRHVLYPASNNLSLMTRIQRDPRWTQSWYNRHHEVWWPRAPHRRLKPSTKMNRDWNVSLGTAAFEPLFDYSFSISPETGNGTLNSTDELNGSYLATGGTLVVSGASDAGSYALLPGGPGTTLSPGGAFTYDDLLTSTANPPIDVNGLLFTGSGLQINIEGNGTNTYSYADYNGTAYENKVADESGTFTVNTDPGGGQMFPAKYTFDVTATPSCTNDYVVVGIPATPASGGQANIVGYNNLYTGSSPSGICSGTGPTVMFAYASGSGEVPGSISLSLDGTKLAYVEDLLTGSSYFHVLTIGTTGSNGTSATAAAVPSSGNNAVDLRRQLETSGVNQSSTTSPFIDYSDDAAYVTTYSWAGAGSGYLYKISPVFGGGTPEIVWSIQITAVPSGPIFDYTSKNVFFTDSHGRVDYVTDIGSPPSSVTYGSVLASGTTSLNPVTVDSVNEEIYATFNTNGTNALLVQVPINTNGTLGSPVDAPIGVGNTIYKGPYGVAFNNAWYTSSGPPDYSSTGAEVFVMGTCPSASSCPSAPPGVQPWFYGVGFTSGVLNTSVTEGGPIGTGGLADGSAPTEFYNAATGKDYVFLGVTNSCWGGIAGCVWSFDLTDDTYVTPPLAVTGGPSGIIVDNDSSDPQASSAYFVSKTGGQLVKATQSGLD